MIRRCPRLYGRKSEIRTLDALPHDALAKRCFKPLSQLPILAGKKSLKYIHYCVLTKPSLVSCGLPPLSPLWQYGRLLLL